MGGANSGEPNGGSAVSRSTATLLLGETTDERRDTFARLDGPAAVRNVLVVSAERSTMAVVDDWRAGADQMPAAFGLVTFAEFGRSAGATSSQPARQPLPGRDITLTAMSDLSNLQRLGTAVTLYLDDWAETDRETFVYLDALGPFVDANGAEPTFQFLHLLVQTVTEVGATLVVRLDPSAVDEQTINTLRSLFDEVVDVESDRLDTDALRDLLGNDRRRFVVQSLIDADEVGLDRLAARLARWENGTPNPTAGEQNRAYTALASVHVPQLAEAGLVVFDRADERVRLSTGARRHDRIERFLERAFDDE